MKVLAIIPAREGSKGIRDKNIAPCCGKPLIAWSIIAAKKASEIDRVIISTDSQRYKEILEHDYGADLFPFLRPERIAQDKTPSSDVILHAIKALEEQDEFYDIVILLECTSPLRTPEQINESIQLLKNAPQARALVSVVEDSNHHPLLAFEVNKNGKLIPYGSEKAYPGHPRRQALRPAFFMSGDIYISYVDEYKERKSFNHELTAGYKVEHWQTLEVDEPHDLICIEALLKARNEHKL